MARGMEHPGDMGSPVTGRCTVGLQGRQQLNPTEAESQGASLSQQVGGYSAQGETGTFLEGAHLLPLLFEARSKEPVGEARRGPAEPTGGLSGGGQVSLSRATGQIPSVACVVLRNLCPMSAPLPLPSSEERPALALELLGRMTVT